MKTNIVIDISPPISGKIQAPSYGPKCCWAIELQDSLKCNISRKKWIKKFILGMLINIKAFYKLILSFWVHVARHAQSTQSKKFSCLCYISRNTLRDDKHEGFLQGDSITLGVQNTQNKKFAISLQYLKENVDDEVDFLPVDKSQRFLQNYTIILLVCGQACPNNPK